MGNAEKKKKAHARTIRISTGRTAKARAKTAKKMRDSFRNSRHRMKLIFFHSSLVGFCEFIREQIEEVEDTKGLDTIAELITKTAKEELVYLCLSGSISNRDLKMFEDKHRQFFDNNIEGASFVAGLSFYLGKVDDFLGTVAADGRRTGAVTINPKRIARLEQMRGLIQTAIDILELEYETHLDYAPEQFEADLVKASSVIDSYEGLFDRSRAA